MVPPRFRGIDAREGTGARRAWSRPFSGRALAGPALLAGGRVGTASARLIPRATGAGARRRVPMLFHRRYFNDSMTPLPPRSSNQSVLRPPAIVVAAYPLSADSGSAVSLAASGDGSPPPHATRHHHAVITLMPTGKAAGFAAVCRPSLRNAVTASAVVADKDCSSGNTTSTKYPGVIEITLGAPC